MEAPCLLAFKILEQVESAITKNIPGLQTKVSLLVISNFSIAIQLKKEATRRYEAEVESEYNFNKIHIQCLRVEPTAAPG